MVVSEDDVINIMGGMEHAGGIKLNDHKRKLKNRFEICRKLGQGTYGKVQLGINRETGQQVAIKTIKKSKIETEADLIRIRREIQIMSSVQHPNIIHIYEVFENKEKMVLVMEIAAGGELYDYLSERKCLEENEAKRIFRQIATAVYYCHKNNICHRDLKLENILLDENGNAKIADFGLSNVYDGKNLLTTFCGSPLYASPEIVRGSPYAGPEVDCWSLGVLLYTLVYGAMPFDGSNFKRLVKQITTGDYYEPKQPSAASSLIRTMLTVRSEKRANIGDICSHWWVNDGYPETCLEEAEFLASLTPVRLDLLLSLAPGNNESKSEPVDMRPEESVQDPSMSGVSSNEPAMSIVELPLGAEAEVAGSTTESRISISEPPDEENSQHVRRREKEKVKRKLTETPSMLDPDLVHKKRESDGTGDAMLKHDEIPVPMEEEPSTRRGTSQSPVPGGKTVRIRKKKEEPTVERLGVEETHPGYPQISPDLPRKPPPKPKMKEPEISSENQAEMKRRNSRKERNVKTPDPYHHIVPKEEQRPMTPRTHANERPMTPRQGRAPSPEERPLVVPLPPPRVEQITLPPPRPPPRSESPAPPLPPRPKMEQEEGPPKLIVVPLPPPMIVREPPQQMEVVLDDRRKSKFYPDDSSNQHDEPTHIEPVEVKRNLEAPLEDKSPIVIHSNQPPPLPEKKKTKSPQMPRSEKQSQSVQMPSGLEQSEISNHDKPNVAGSAESIEPSIQNQQKLNIRPKILSESQENKFENKIRKSPSKEKEVQPTILFETNKESAPKTPPAKPKDMTSQKYPIEIREEETNLKCKDEPTNYQETLLPPLPQLIGKVTIESNHVPNVMVSLPPISNNAGLLIEQTSKEAKNQSFKEDIKELPKPLLVNQLEQSTIESNTNHLGDLRIGHTATTHEAKVTTPSTNETSKNISQEVDIKNSSFFHEPASVKEQSKPSYIESKSEIEKPMKINEQLHIITSIPSISAEVRSSSPLVKEVALMSPKENSTSKEDIGSPKKDEVNCRSLINSVPKPFKAESPPTNEGNNDSLQREHQSESVRSCSSLSSSGSNQSLSRRPSLQQQNSQQDDLSLISPGSCSLPRPEKRDSKVIKAAQYWNNYIGEVLVKNKPPENPKSLEKPKKIVSAGVGPKGYSDLKNTFEQGGLQRRNSKKLTVDSCLPGLRVTDAKSAFEKKNQPPTPVIYRKNSVVSDTKEKPKWVRPVKVENEQEFPFINKPSDDLKSRAKAKILSEKDTLSDKTFVNGVTNNKDDILKINGSSDRSNENDLNSNELSKQKIKDHNIVIKVQSSNQTPKLNDTTETQQNNVHPKSPKTKAKVLTVKAQETLPIHPTQADSMISQPSVTHRDIQEGKDGSKIETLSTESTKTSKPLELTSKQPDINKKSLTISTKPVTEIENKTIEDAAKKTQTPVLIKEPHTFVTKPVQKEETVKKLKSGLVVIVNNKVRSQPVVINNNLNVVNPGSSSPKAIAKPTIDPKSPPTPPKIIQKAFDPEPTKEESKKSFEAIPKSREDNKQAIDNVSEGQNNVPVKLKEELVISGKAETPEPSNPIEAAKNALKKVPHAPAMRRKSLESSPVADTGNEETQKDNKTNESLHTPVPTAVPATPINDLTSPPIKTVTSIPLQVEPLASHGERVIPIKIEPDSRSRENPSSKREHYIPIVVEGRGTILKTPEPSYIPHEDQEEAERFDTFTTDSLSRRRWGSRKKRFSSAYSDSASVSTEEDLNNESAFAGLQKYTSIGKHGMEEAPMFRLRKTRPPFALQREESFSSGEEDVFNDDGFREMTAENLFSTLLTRVKSLTRRIHDEHEDNPALRWQQNKRIINHPLNPGGTHARLERSALRSSLKRSGPPSSAASTAPSLSRQSSSDASRLSSYARSEDPRASYDDMGSQYRGSGASYLSQQPITSRSSNTAHTSKRPLDNRKLSYELRSNEMDIINKLKREAAERSNDYLGDIDGEFDAMDEMGERLLRKRSGYLSRNFDRLDEDDTLLSPSRHLTRRSISRELFGGGGGGSDIDRTSSILSGSSSISGSRPVTRRSISRELFDYSPTGNVSSTGRITPTLGLGTSPARRSTVDYSRSSRERSLGRETSGLSNDFDRSNLDRNRSLGSRRSESLTRGGGNSGLSSGLSTTSSTTTSRPSLSTQGRSLTQNEFIRTSPRSSVSGRLSAGLDEDSSKIRSSALTDRGSALNDRGRADWRRVSVPERGKDYTTLQSKYKRLDPSKHSYQ